MSVQSQKRQIERDEKLGRKPFKEQEEGHPHIRLMFPNPDRIKGRAERRKKKHVSRVPHLSQDNLLKTSMIRKGCLGVYK
jgi:hypothetical protein